MNTREVIDTYYSSVNRGDWDTWLTLFADDVVMDEQIAGHVEGIATLRGAVGGIKKVYSKFFNRPKQIVVSGDEATVVSVIEAASAAGVPVTANVANYFRIKDGKITYMANFHDTRPFDPVFHPETAAPKASKYPIVHRFIGRFMQLPKDHVNAYIVELEHAVVVIDATIALSSARALRQKAESFGKPIAAVLLTHGHPDHYTGLVVFPDVPRVASQGCLDFAREEDLVKAPTATMLLGDDYPKTRLFPNEIVKDGDTRTYDGVTFTFRDTGPAESPSDGAWLVRQGAVTHAFVGDTVAPKCHCFFRDGFVREWNAALDRLEREFDDQVRFYPGHGDPCGKEAIAWQRGYNNAFLNAVAALPNQTVPVGPESEAQVLAAVKKYLPDDTLLFLFQFELAYSIGLAFPQRGFGRGMGKLFYAEHMQMLGQGKFEEAALRHYTEDCAIVTFDGIHHGRAELKEYIAETFRRHQQITGVKMEYFHESEDVIIFRATVTSTGRGTINAQDAFYLENGKIRRHIALTLVPDADYVKLGTRWKE